MKILFIVSEEGYWAEECVEPLKILSESHQITLATPTGSVPEADPESIDGYTDFIDKSDLLNDPVPLMEAYRRRDEFKALVLPGGHGTLWDINQDEHVQEILEEKMEDKGVLAICHAVGVLGFTPEITEAREVTGFPNEWEDSQVEDEVRDGRKLPYRVEDIVREAGADWDAELDREVSVKQDGRLVTARGPDSSREAAEQFARMIEK